MNVVLLLAHSIEEHDQVKLLSGLGYDVFSIGSYEDPAHPGDDARPGIPEATDHPELREACREHRARMERDYGSPDKHVDWAKWMLPGKVLDWADVIICHHIEWEWLVPQWPLIRDKRVIWRTVGQSVTANEQRMAPLRDEGLQIVRYSPKERAIPGYLGEDAVIRFYKDPDEWCGWIGDDPRVVNVTQNLRQRDPWTNWRFWEAATADLPRLPIGAGSDEIGGTGRIPYGEMQEWLRRGRVYLYCGTQPASYTLGLIEAMMTGIPVISIGPTWMDAFPYGADLFEGHELTRLSFDNATEASRLAVGLLKDHTWAAEIGHDQRLRAIELFGREAIGQAWREFLG